jgi:hypothetical protein
MHSRTSLANFIDGSHFAAMIPARRPLVSHLLPIGCLA